MVRGRVAGVVAVFQGRRARCAGELGSAAASRALAIFLAMVAATLCLGCGVAEANQLITITIPDRHGEIASKWLSYPGLPRANVLLPDGFHRLKRYPLLVMLNGLGGDYAQDTQLGLTAPFDGLNAIVVMPEGGSGWYTDWWNDGERGGPAWESYFLNEVMPTILARYRILPQRRYHALAGISMGGMGAANLGGRLPGYFGSVESLSGFVDPQYMGEVVDPGMGVTSQAAPNGDYDVDPVEGPPDGFYMTGHNPTEQAMNLKQTRVFESTGTGVPSSAGLADPTAPDTSVAEGSVLERLAIYPMNQLYHSALVAAGVDVTYQVHSGGHDTPDFLNEVKAMVAWGLFKPVVTDPRSWLNTTVATTGQLWDIRYHFGQPPNRIVQFHRSGSSLSITAAGSAVTITTTGGCVINTGTPAAVRIPKHSCRRHETPSPPRTRRGSRGYQKP
jgi:S-formylglutathione hydrolase FrmB